MSRIKVVGDPEELRRFFENVMIPLQEDWVYVLLGVARKKYSDGDSILTRSEEALVRELITDYDYDRLVRFLKRLEVDEECYVDRNSGLPIPQSCMAYYIDLTPKSASKATAGFFKDYMDDLMHARTDPLRLERLRRIKPHIFSHASKNNATKKPYRIIDMDIKAEELLKKVIILLAEDEIPITWISETRGGYHIIIPVGDWLASFYKTDGTRDKIRALDNEYKLVIDHPGGGQEFKSAIEFPDHCQTPIPGTFQGGHLVKRV